MKQKRRPPRDLYETVLELTTAIAQPDNAQADPAVANDALGQLAALFEGRQAAGKQDPFLTETMADFTTDVNEAIRLYRLAIQQCASFPDEPIHTKRQGLVERLFQAGRNAEAQAELAKAKQEAFAAADTDAIKELSTLAERMAV